MYDRILFPTDGGEGAADVLEHVLDIASASGATLYVLNVADTGRDSVTVLDGEFLDVLEREGERIVGEAASEATERGIEVVTEVIQGTPHQIITDYARTHAVDLVVMPTHGRRGLERLLLGSVTERVVRTSAVPVLTLSPDDEVAYPYERIAFATDGSEGARAALQRAIDVATTTGAGLSVISVVDTATLGPDVYSNVELDRLSDRAEAAVEAAVDTAETAGVEHITETVEYGTVHRTVLDHVEATDADLLVIGTHGRTGLERYLLGSVAEKLVRSAPVPVLTVQAPEIIE